MVCYEYKFTLNYIYPMYIIIFGERTVYIEESGLFHYPNKNMKL